MVRGIERSNIFNTENDQKDFLKRLSTTLTDTQTPCYAYALMSNHFHVLLQTGPTPISKVMQSLLTGYAVSYNLRHNRAGKLYQNRFKSILCDKEEYLLQLIRYIHLNPIRVKLISNITELETSPLTGHSILMGKRKTEKDENTDWLDAEEVLSNFGETMKKARGEYGKYIQEGIDEEEPLDFDGGGLKRSVGGLWEVLTSPGTKKKKKEAADERILGTGAFVEAALHYAEEEESKASKLQREGWDFKKVLDRAAKSVGVSPEELMYHTKHKARSQGRALLCKWLVDDLRNTQSSVAENLRVTQSTVSKLVNRGRSVEKKMGVCL
jgi:REP element-mobilizing transposase RayT